MKRSRFMMVLVLGCLFLLQANITLARVKVTETITKTFALTPNGDLSISNINGRIRIESWNKDSVKVVAEKIIRTSSRERAKEYLKELRIEFDSGTDYLNVKPIYPKGLKNGWNFFDWLFGTGARADITVHFHLWVPRTANIESASVNGSSIISDMSGDIDSKCTNGKIALKNVTGDISAKTVNGRIEASISDAGGLESLDLKTINGSINLELPKSAGGRIELATVNGSIQSDFPIKISGKISKHKMRGRFGKGHSRIQLSTINGSIRVTTLFREK